MFASTPWASAAAYATGLALTLALAAGLTPRRWWRRPTAANLALAGAGTLACGALLCWLFGAWTPVAPAPAQGAAFARSLAPDLEPNLVRAPGPARYRVVDDLNLRSGRATGAPRLAVLPAGTLVTATGATDGDWWQVSAEVGGQRLEGWASSLWLRRADEHRVGRRAGDG